MSTPLRPWSVRAVNLPEHADNPVHTRDGGLAAGYAGAVVAGTTVYAYLTRPVAEAWGTDWVTGGTADVRFRAPVLADEPVEILPEETDDGWTVEARNASGTCAVLQVARAGPAPGEPTGARLEPLVVELDDRWAGYGARAGEDLPFYAETGLVHPVVWPALSNRLFSAQLVDGAWVHTRSAIRHLGGARPGDTALVEGWLLDRFTTRSGERVVVDVRVSVGHRPVAVIEHEAIVRLASPSAGAE